MHRLRLRADEQLVAAGRTHPKVLVPTVALAVIVVAAVLYIDFPRLATAVIERADVPAPVAFWLPVLAVLAFGCWLAVPVVQWFTSTWALTNERVLTRSGLVWISGHDLSLTKVTNVETERGLLDRIFGCGTLVLHTAAEQPVRLVDIPGVESIRYQIAGLAGPRV